METIRYFGTFEERELQFRHDVNFLLPRKYSGPAIFWNDMASAISSISEISDSPIACISSNPRDCLAYSFVDDLLNAAKLTLPLEQRDDLLNETIRKYDIEPIRGQQIHTLSGGEVVRLSLAKNDLLSINVENAIISSPLTWLSPSSRPFYDLFLKAYSEKGKNVSILSMDGENDLDLADIGIDSSIESEIIFKDLKIKLSSDEFDSDVRETWATVEDIELGFSSPCFLTGDNGSGKSLLAKALSGALHYTGDAKIKTNGYLGKTRLLFQDVILQTMLRPFSVLASSAKCVSGLDASKYYLELISSFTDYFSSKELKVPFIGEANSESKTLLEYKFFLVAIRLCSKPTAIILDEPDWGLTRETAIAFVKSVIESAHDKGVPVIIISHKEWWRGVAKTRLEASKRTTDREDIKYHFSIKKLSPTEE
ncbi:MAG: hypothetical protein H8E09_01065 [Gammaproteobacteria bacterium]|nr:hypothetical protein [Gammaproteobacteria bacterium]